MNLNENALIVLKKRYQRKDSKGRTIETPEELFERVADSIAKADEVFGEKPAAVEKTRKKFLTLMTSMAFLPNSPTLMNAGSTLGQLAACFVLPIEDSMESIFETLKQTALIHKSGGGTGFSFSRIRPANDVVHSTAGISSGPLSFMSVFDVATETVKQGGTRRGANMGILRVDHPDIEAFTKSKNDLKRYNNFNISVAVTDEFMEACENDSQYSLVNPRTGKVEKRLKAREVFEMIAHSAWLSGEPGVIFIDRINRDNPTPELGEIESTNPCGEQPLLPLESCTLGSINLSKITVKGKIDFNKLKKAIHTAVHFLDNVIEVNKYPLEQIKEKSRATRKIGLGVMGFADMLISMGIAYDSDEAVKTAEEVMSFVDTESKTASAALAKKRGNFPAYKMSIHDNAKKPDMRNAATTTIAPTGTISIIAGVSSGIEPLFAVAHSRHVLDGRKLFEINPQFVKATKKAGIYSDDLVNKVATLGSVQNIAEVPGDLKAIFKTSHDIAPQWHIKMQAAFQKYTDNAVSKTVNCPPETSREDVENIYLSAYKAGCKGVTIYRYGSRETQVLNIGTEETDESRVAPRARPVRTKGMTERISTGCGKLYVTVNFDEKGMCEVFAQMGKTGGCASSQIEAAGRLISLALRSGVNIDSILKQLIGIRCPSPAWQSQKMVLSCPDAIAQVLKNIANSDYVENVPVMGVCPECGGAVSHQEGCLVCHICGYSKCS